MEVKLFAPEYYWLMPKETVDALDNGCGPKKFGWLVRDDLLGLCISTACRIHDIMYNIEQTIDGKDSADRVFLNNMLRIIDSGTRWNWLKVLRRREANIYYEAVHKFGGPAFWAGKNKNCEEKTVIV